MAFLACHSIRAIRARFRLHCSFPSQPHNAEYVTKRGAAQQRNASIAAQIKPRITIDPELRVVDQPARQSGRTTHYPRLDMARVRPQMRIARQTLLRQALDGVSGQIDPG